MPFPKNPDTILLKNKYYTSGLTELEIWNYYQRVKTRILQEVKNSEVMVWIAVEKNKLVIRRIGKDKNPIRLNNSNYDNIITGRTISIHTGMSMYEDVAIIDVDIDNFKKAKLATLETYNFALNNIPVVNDASIIYTGKTSFHIKCKLTKKLNVNTIREVFRKYLLESDLAKKYSVALKRTRGVANLDLSPIKYRGNFITLHSLSILGLRSMKLRPTEVMSFQIGRARI